MAQAYLYLGLPKEAKKTLVQTQISLGFKNKDFEDKIKALTSLIREQEFFASIEKDDEIDKMSPD